VLDGGSKEAIRLGAGFLSTLAALVIASILAFALSVSSALFLIVDLSQPFDGLMQISNHHLRMVLQQTE
jgi:Protein of unknown function (DUF4239)